MTDWSMFPAACYAYDEKRVDILHSFREEVYAHGMPWHLGPPVIGSQNLRVLMRSMAVTLQDGKELTTLFTLMDEARQHGMAWATADAGDVLVDRAKGKRGTAPLPDDWVDRARVATTHGKNSSAAYWGGAMLRAAGHHLAEPDAGDRGVA